MEIQSLSPVDTLSLGENLVKASFAGNAQRPVVPGSTGTSVSAPSIVKRGRRAFSAGDLMLICDHSELTFRNALIAQPSCITNMSCGLSATPRSHAEELESTRLVEEKFERLVCGLVRRAGRG